MALLTLVALVTWINVSGDGRTQYTFQGDTSSFGQLCTEWLTVHSLRPGVKKAVQVDAQIQNSPPHCGARGDAQELDEVCPFEAQLVSSHNGPFDTHELAQERVQGALHHREGGHCDIGAAKLADYIENYIVSTAGEG